MSSSPFARMRPKFGDDELSTGQARSILINTLSWGGIAVIPSDCGWAIAALPDRPVGIRALDALLDHSKNPIPLSVASYSMATRYVDLSMTDRRIAEHVWPGQVTIVANARREGKKILQALHHQHGDQTLGMRVTQSAIERYLSAEADSPLTTAAIRDDTGRLVKTYDEAVDIILSRLHRVDAERTLIVGVSRRKRIDDRDHSTVVQINGTLKVIREGAVPETTIRQLMTRSGSTDWGDAT